MIVENTLEYVLKKLQVDSYRLRGPMPIELPNFNRNDLAKLFNELGFKKGAEIGVAEGHYSEVLLQSIPDLELMSIDPWIKYKENPRAHSEEHQNFSRAETERRLKPYPKAKIIEAMSMDAVKDVPYESIDFCYLDGNHNYDYIMLDVIEWSRRVRRDGCVSGDDLYSFKYAGVQDAIFDFTRHHKINPWFLIQAPRSVDFFWVKP